MKYCNMDKHVFSWVGVAAVVVVAVALLQEHDGVHYEVPPLVLYLREKEVVYGHFRNSQHVVAAVVAVAAEVAVVAQHLHYKI